MAIRIFTNSLKTLFLAFFFGLSSCINQTATYRQKPNIILVVADDHGTDALGCYGNPVIQTPNLDNFAAEGIRFNNAYCTSASCTASRSVILTGKYGHATASYGHSHVYHHFSSFENLVSLPVLLERAGYMTARIGKYHVAPESVYRFSQVLQADARNPVEMAEKCKDVFKSKEPFFLYFCTDDPHRWEAPGTTKKEWNEPNSFGNKPEGYPGIEKLNYKPEDVIVPWFLPDSKECRQELAQYYQSVSRIDQGFGRLMELLEKSGKLQNTIVIYISDNGIAFPGAKTTAYEPGLKLPCIIKSPFVKAKGIVNNAKISWVDLTPTILDMAGVSFESKSFHGKSFKSVLDKENPPGWDEVFASHTFHEITMYYPMRVYIKNNFKLIRNLAWRLEYPFASDLWASSTWQEVIRKHKNYYGKRKVQDYLYRPEFELYDLGSDPYESVNLAANQEYKAVFDEMKAKLMDFQKSTSDPWLILDNYKIDNQ